MKRTFKITEEQYNRAIQEGLELSADVAATNGNVQQAVTNTIQQANKAGVDKKDVNINIKGSDLHESKKRTLSRTSTPSAFFSKKDFINALQRKR